MPEDTDLFNRDNNRTVADIIKDLDHDIEHGEDILMLGLCAVMMSTFFAPIAPPVVLLPLVTLIFAISAGLARKNYHNMEQKLIAAQINLNAREQLKLQPISNIFYAHPMPPLAESFNPLKNIKRTLKSVLGGILINPFWMPIFFMMGIQINEEKNLILLNRAVMLLEQQNSTQISILI